MAEEMSMMHLDGGEDSHSTFFSAPPTPTQEPPQQSITVSIQRPTIGRKTLPPVPTRVEDDTIEPSSDDDSESDQHSSSSSSEDSDDDIRRVVQPMKRPLAAAASSVRCSRRDHHRGHHHHHQHKRSRSSSRSESPSPSPKAKKHKKKDSGRRTQQMDRDAQKVAPLPFMRFLKARLTPKACGRCIECRKPACGICRACVQNAKTDAKRSAEPSPALAASAASKDRRRCEALKCTKDSGDLEITMPKGIPDNKDSLTDELAKVSSDLAEMSVKRGQSDFNEKQYDMTLDRMRALREGLTIIKNRKARFVPRGFFSIDLLLCAYKRRRTKFQVGFHDVWGVLTSLEKDRLKFSKFIVRTASSEECRTIDMKRMMRDDLEAMQIEIANKHSALLCPFEEKEAFMAELEKTRS